MRINHRPEPKPGDRRGRSAFLWCPRTIGMQTRWLERASWLEELTVWPTHNFTTDMWGERHVWEPVSWTEDSDGDE